MQRIYYNFFSTCFDALWLNLHICTAYTCVKYVLAIFEWILTSISTKCSNVARSYMGAAHFVCVHFIMFTKLNRFSHCVCVPQQLQNSKFSWLNSTSSCMHYSGAHVFRSLLLSCMCDCMWSPCSTLVPMLFVVFVLVSDKIENKNRYAATRIYKTVPTLTHTQAHNIIRLDYIFNAFLIAVL